MISLVLEVKVMWVNWWWLGLMMVFVDVVWVCEVILDEWF